MPKVARLEGSAPAVDGFVDTSVDLARIPDVEWVMRYSELNTLAHCATQYQVEYALGLKPPNVKPSNMRGSAYHALMQGWYSSFAEDDAADTSRDVGKAIERAYQQLGVYEDHELGGRLPDPIREKVDWAFEGYRERFGTDSDWFKILWVEHHRTVPLVDVELDGVLYRVILRTTADLVAQSRRTGRVYLIDHKTAEGRDVSKDAYSKENQLDPQRPLYTASFKRRGPVEGRLPIWSALHNVVRCDRLKRKMTIEERFGRHPVFYGDAELDQVWSDAQLVATEAVKQRLGIGIKYPSPDPMTCFPAGTSVALPPKSRIESASRRWYQGPMVSIVTAGGQQVSATPNHPIMTDRGWVFIGDLSQRDRIVCAPDLGQMVITTDEQLAVATIDQVFDSFGSSSQRVPGSSAQFHGDGTNEEVHVVFPDGRLTDDSPMAGQPSKQQIFTASDSGAPVSTLIPVSGLSDELVLGSGPESPVQLPGLPKRVGSREGGPVVIGQDSGHGGAGQAQSLGDSQDRLSSVEHLDDDRIARPIAISPASGSGTLGGVGLNIGGLLSETSSLGGGSAVDTAIGQTVLSGGGTYVELLSQRLYGLTGNESFDQIVDLRFSEFTGHVYNLQTTSGSYFANTILASNCKWCSLREPHIMARQTGRSLGELAREFGFKTEQERGLGETFADDATVDTGF